MHTVFSVRTECSSSTLCSGVLLKVKALTFSQIVVRFAVTLHPQSELSALVEK